MDSESELVSAVRLAGNLRPGGALLRLLVGDEADHSHRAGKEDQPDPPLLLSDQPQPLIICLVHVALLAVE